MTLEPSIETLIRQRAKQELMRRELEKVDKLTNDELRELAKPPESSEKGGTH